MMPDRQTLEAVAQRLEPGAKLLRAWQPTGGISAQVAAFEIAQADGQTKRLFLRRHGAVDRQLNPRIAADEYRLLRLLAGTDVPAPWPCGLDMSCELLPAPYLVIEYIEGQPEYAPADVPGFVGQLAWALARIHAVHAANADLAFLPEPETRYARYLRERPQTPDATLDAGRIRAALEAHWPPPRWNAPVLLHHDFWPGNLLWRGGQLVAVIDWEDAACGDPLADLANTRMEVLWAFGMEAAQRFTQQYHTLMPAVDLRGLPFWDLCVALRQVYQMPALYDGWAALGRPDITAETMRAAHRWFVAQALEKL